jgi:hypothetical protein
VARGVAELEGKGEGPDETETDAFLLDDQYKIYPVSLGTI